MTEASHNTFVDRRTTSQTMALLATQVLFWYDEEGKGKKKRRRTNGLAVTTDGNLVVARAVCSRKDQFVKSGGRLVVGCRIEGRAQQHCWVLTVDKDLEPCEAMAAAYREMFPGEPVDEDGKSLGSKRAYNAGRIFTAYRQEISRRASEMEDV